MDCKLKNNALKFLLLFLFLIFFKIVTLLNFSKHNTKSDIPYMSPNLDKIYEVVLTLTKECGKLIKQRIRAPKQIEIKSCETDFVTDTDKEVEKRLIEGLVSQFPDHKFIGEETTATGVKPELTSAPTWIIDPVDGTMNFVHGFPIVCISIGLLIERTPEIGIIYNPILEQLFTARKGLGAFLNGNRIHVSNTQELNKSLIQIEHGSNRLPDKKAVNKQNIDVVGSVVHAIRASGSSAWNMAMVGLGGAEAYIEFGLHAWDMAAGDLIVREAGGVVMDPSGGQFDLMSCRLLCCNSDNLAKQLIPLIKQYYPPRDA